MNKAELIGHLSGMASEIDAKGERQIKIGHYTVAKEGQCRAEALRYAIAKIEQLTEPECLTIDDYSISAASSVGKNHAWILRQSGEGMSVDLDKLFAECF